MSKSSRFKQAAVVACCFLFMALLAISHPVGAQTATDIPVWFDVSDTTPPNIKLNQDATTQLQNEEQVAVDPTNPDNLVAVWRDFRLGYRQIGWGYSHDGGVSWTDGGLIGGLPYDWNSDPAIVANSSGRFYTVLLSFESAGPANGIFLPVSFDSGNTWGTVLTGVETLSGPFEDKEMIACDQTHGPTDGSVYVAWTRFTDSTAIHCIRSTDGFSFGVPRPVSDKGGVQWPTPAVGNDGRVVIAWCSFARSAIMCDISTNQGQTWGTDRVVAPLTFGAGTINGGILAFSFPALTADVTDGPYDGRFYCAFTDNGADGFLDLYMTVSTDSGKTWSPRQRLSDDPVGNGIDQFHPWIAVNPDGVVSVAFYDRRLDPANLNFDLWITHSFDGGQSWTPNQRVSNVSSNPFNAATEKLSPQYSPYDNRTPITLMNPNAGLIGEYIGLATSRMRATAVFTDTRNLNQDVYAANMPLRLFPPKVLSPVSGLITSNPAVTFSWSDWSFYDSALAYILVYSTDPTFATGVTRHTLTTQSDIVTLSDGQYSWRVRAFDIFGDSSGLSEVRTIWIDNTPPALPTPVPPSPMANDTIVDSTPTFAWTAVIASKSPNTPTPVTYQLQVAADLGFSVGLRDFSALGSTSLTLSPANKLAASQFWYWRVKAVDGAGNESGYIPAIKFFVSPAYIMGDFDANQVTDVFDVIKLIEYVFSGGAEPVPPAVRVDMNCDSVYDVFDVIKLINVAFEGGTAPFCP